MHLSRQKEHAVERYQTEDDMDMSILVLEGNSLTFSGAKNPLYFIQNGELQIVKGSKYPVGSKQYGHEKQFDMHQFSIQPKDVVYIFSDGFQDQFGGKKHKKYLTKRFRQLLYSMHQLPTAEQQSMLNNELKSWKGTHEQTDDILVIGLKF